MVMNWKAVLIIALQCHVLYGLSPILIFPGLGGSQLHARVSNHGWLCNTEGSFESYWLNVLQLAECSVSSVLKLQYDKLSGQYSNTSNAEVIAYDFGGTKAVEYLEFFPYFHKFVSFFVERGYVRGETIRAAPYDWRIAADELDRLGYYDQVINLIEEMFSVNQERVTIVAYSMGGPVSLYLLNHGKVSQEWKDKYINAYIPLSGAWSGGNDALGVLLSGMSFLGFPYALLDKSFSATAQSLQSSLWLLPDPIVWGNITLITTATRTYSANDYQALFNDLSMPETYIKVMKALKINNNWPAPNVSVHCFYGTNLITPESFSYGTGGFPTKILKVQKGDGDGTVNLRSSEVCLRWSSQQAAPFTHRTFNKVSHGNMVNDQEVIDEIAEIVGVPASLASSRHCRLL